MDMMHFSRQVLVHPANVHLNNDLNLQPGPPRTTEETTAGISDQLFLACRGQPDPVEDLQRNTGIKDKTAQFWIDMVTPKANEEIKLRTTNREMKDLRLKKKGLSKEERKAIKNEIKDGVQKEMFSWLIQQPPDRYDALAETSCEWK